MAPEPKPADSRAALQRNAELILSRLSDYLSVRFDMACRINPQLKAIKQDLMYHELTNVRRCLLGSKIYGPSRMTVTDVFLGDDDRKRKGLMSASDQTSIQVDIVSHCQDSRVEATRGQIRFHDLKGFYAAIDPRLSDLMDLVETWIWWDIQDATEIVRFEQKMGVIQTARQGRLGEEGRKHYAPLIHPPTADDEGAPPPPKITDEDILRYEFKQLMTIREQWHYRRGNERGFMYVLKRDELPARGQGEAIHRIASRVREYDAIEGMDELDEELRHRYATDLRTTPDKVTRAAVLDFLQNQMIQVEREMVREAEHEAQLGPPYNYKDKQLEQIDKVLADLANQLRAILQPGQAGQPVGAGAKPVNGGNGEMPPLE